MTSKKTPDISQPLSTQEAKYEELKMLVAFRDFCRELDLRYSLCGGTLLGAVRHRGFIPWDDDVDVCMPRPDYDRFLELGNAFADRCAIDLEGYCGLDLDSSPFVKLLHREIAVKADVDADESRLWIDVFPVDALPDDDMENNRLYGNVKRIRRLILFQHSAPCCQNSSIKNAVIAISRPLLGVLHADRWSACRLQEIAAQRPWGSTSHVGALTWGLYGPGERMPLEAFDSTVAVDFEGESFSAMNCWHEYLLGIYGNYMELPPENERLSHGIIAWRI